jgi:putative transposase
MSYASDLTDEQWALLEPVFNAPGKRGPKHAPDLRWVVDAMLYISHTGCQWRFLPESFGPWTRVWSQFRRWSRNGTWARALTVLHKAAREADGRTEATPSMVVIDTHLARGASNGGFTFHDRGGPYGRTRGAKRVVAVDVTGLPVGALVVPASTHENRTSQVMLEHLTRQGGTERLELVLVDRGVTAAGARKLGRRQGLEVRRVGWDDEQPVFPTHPPRLARRGRPRPAGTRAPTGEVVREHHHLSDRLAPDHLHRDHPASPVSCPWTPSPGPSRGVDVGRSPCAHRGTCASPRASWSDLYSASAGVTRRARSGAIRQSGRTACGRGSGGWWRRPTACC